MIKSKLFSSYNFQRYIYLVLVSNFLAIFFLRDTTSLNLGLLSIQSLFYSINLLLFSIFILFETVSSFIDYYGLTFNFLKLTIIDIYNLNVKFSLQIFYKNLNYIFFLVLNISLIYFRQKLIGLFRSVITNKKLLFLSFIIFIILATSIFIADKKIKQVEAFNNRALNKLNFVFEEKFFRDDNWYIVFKNTLNYNNKTNISKNFSFNEIFKNSDQYRNIYVVIIESYPNFKDKNLKNKLTNALESNLQNFKISKYKKDWNKNYSTQGAEFDFFCDKKGTFNEFKFDFKNFLTKNDCWINKFENRHNIYIHSYDEEHGNRGRYYLPENSFFNEVYFKNDLIKLGYNLCNTNYFIGVCEKEIINKLLKKFNNNNKKKFILYLTVENHIPVYVKNYDEKICKNYTLTLHEQFCTLFHNQINFNKEMNKFIKNLNSNDLLVIFSDTPPIFPQRERVHFENYIDVFKYEKIF